MQPAATLISLNFSSLIRDLQQNPSLQETICFPGSQLSNWEASPWVGWLCAEPPGEEVGSPSPVSRLNPSPLVSEAFLMALQSSAPMSPPHALSSGFSQMASAQAQREIAWCFWSSYGLSDTIVIPGSTPLYLGHAPSGVSFPISGIF